MSDELKAVEAEQPDDDQIESEAEDIADSIQGMIESLRPPVAVRVRECLRVLLAMADESESDDESEEPQAPAIILTPESLRNKLEQLGAKYSGGLVLAEKNGIIQNGQLPLVDGTSRGYSEWGKLADIIRADEKLQKIIAGLETGEDGLPYVSPDFGPMPLVRLKQVLEGKLTIYNPYVDFSGDESGELIAFDPKNLKDPEGRLTKKARLQAGDFGRGKLGAVFIDGGPEVRGNTLKMSAIQFADYCEANGYSMTEIANRLMMETTGQHYDTKTWGWLKGYLKKSGSAVRGGWDPGGSEFSVGSDRPSGSRPNLGGRLSVGVSEKA